MISPQTLPWPRAWTWRSHVFKPSILKQRLDNKFRKPFIPVLPVYFFRYTDTRIFSYRTSLLHCAVHGCNSEGHWGCCQGYEITEGISPHCHRHTYCICHDDRKGQSPPSARSCSSSLRSHTINVPPHAALAIVVVLDSSTNPTRGYSPLDCRVLAVFWHLGHFSTMSHILLGIYKKMQRRKLPSNVGDGGYHQFLQVPNQVSLAGKHWFPNPALILKGHILCPLLWYAQRTVIGGRLFRWL